MRILAIRGRNLASLAGDFEVDFNQEPLASAGLFAISGPTGAGKSTLLDALCLALFGDTPRLANATRGQIPDVLHEQIAPSDARTLLRRGKADGFAEVDFVGIDQMVYRARWSIRRARMKSDGRLQKVDCLLTRVSDGQPIGGTLQSEVRDHIERLLGLNFAQFTRAVLLAQNDFANFLKADDDERAALLQTLTGTERFERLSAQVYARATQEKSRLDELNRQLTDAPPLDDEARARLEIAQAEARAAVVAREKMLSILEAAQRWCQEQNRLEAALNQTTQVLQQASQRRQDAAARHTFLEQVDAVATARPLHDKCVWLDAEIERVDKQMHIQAARLQTVSQAQATAAAHLQQALQQRDALLLTNKQAQPEIEAAKQLDTIIQTLTPQYQLARQVSETTKKAVTRHERDRAELLKQREQTAHAQAETSRWLMQQASLASLAVNWAHWEYLLKQAEAAVQQTHAAQTELTRLQQLAAAARKMAVEQRTRLEACTTRLCAATAAEQLANVDYARFDPDQLAAEKHGAEMQRKRLQDAQAHWQAFQERRQQHSTTERDVIALRNASLESVHLVQALQRQRPELEGRLQQAETALKRVQTACNQDVDGLRAGLEVNQPCPVCGALAHPYAQPGVGHQLQALLKAQQADFDALRQDLTRMVQSEASHAATLKAQTQQLQTLEAQLLEQAARLEAASSTWQSALQQSTLETALANLAESEMSTWFVAQREVNQATLDNLSRQDFALRAAQKTRDAAQAQTAAAHQAEQAARTEHQGAQEAVSQWEQAMQATLLRIQQSNDARDHVLTQLDPVFMPADGEPGWRIEWSANPEDFRLAREQAVVHWLKQQHAHELQMRSLESLTNQIDAISAILTKAEETAEEAETRLVQQTREMEGKRQARAQLLDGKSVVDVEATLTRGLETSQTQCNTFEVAARQAATAWTQAKTMQELTQATLTELQQQAVEASIKRSDWLVSFNHATLHPGAIPLDIEGLKQRLGLDREWLADERSALVQLDQAVAHATTILNERQGQLQTHLASRPSAPEHQDMTLIIDALAEQRSMLKQESQLAIEREWLLRQDNDRRVRWAEQMESILSQAGITEIWSKLNDLIGSADGRKFRRIAQQYTLDVLLGYANRHLADLSRRYRLQRLPDGLTLLVVDQDMGDERRSVHSLSGGESFLVSLALALGLASLSSHSVKVESLFIDEGFGSLDSETLAVAMDALDNLQTQGRKVGIISHVHEMAERIGVQIQIKPQLGGQSRLRVI